MLHLGMEIRVASSSDLSAINDIYNQAVADRYCTAHLEPVPLSERREWFDQHDPERFPVFVAELHGRIAGWGSLSPYRKGRQALAHVAEVSYYVERELRRMGVGRSLLEHAISEAPRYGFTVLMALLLDRNEASIALLTGYGFAEWGRMPGIAAIGEEVADHLYFGRRL